MKRFAIRSTFALTLAALAASPAMAKDLEKMRSLDLCVDYYTLKSEADKKAYMAELDRRGQLSVKDHENIANHVVTRSMTMCGMYMSKGKPLTEQGRQIRPMTFKVVHVYPKHYFVSQSGMIVESYERKEGEMPPKLVHEKPSVAPPPVMYGHP